MACSDGHLPEEFARAAGTELSRRALFLGAFAVGCGRRRANRFPGRMFVSSAVERAIAVADLSTFRRMGTLRLSGAPESLFYFSGRVIALCPDAGLMTQIDPERAAVEANLRLPARPVTAFGLVEDSRIAVLGTNPDCIILVDARLNRVTARIPLPGRAEAMDVWRDRDAGIERAAATIPATESVVRITLPEGRIAGSTRIERAAAPLRFRDDGKMLLIGSGAAREIVTVDWSTGALLARLPVPIEPRHFCFTADGGQMFVTGPGEDVVAIVAPYQNEVDQTIPAGRTPAAMAVSDSPDRPLLLVANTTSGDLTILDISTRRLAASVHVGDNPGQVLVTPGGEYAFAVNRGSGMVAVVRLKSVLNAGGNLPGLNSVKPKPLFTMFPMTAAPGSAVVVPQAA